MGHLLGFVQGVGARGRQCQGEEVGGGREEGGDKKGGKETEGGHHQRKLETGNRDRRDRHRDRERLRAIDSLLIN